MTSSFADAVLELVEQARQYEGIVRALHKPDCLWLRAREAVGK